MIVDLSRAAKELITIESTANKPKELQETLDFIISLLSQDEKVTIERFEREGKPSLLAYYGKKRPDRFKVILNGHVDVVPGRPEQFQPYMKDGALYGRGAADMKVAALIMTKVFLQQGHRVSYPLGLQIVTDEEVGGHNGTKYQIEQGVKADFVIAGEDLPAHTICTEMKGICWADIMIRGKTAHSGYPWRGENAILKAQEYITKLLTTYPLPQSEQWATTINVAAIATPDLVYNRVPDEVQVKLDIRYIPEDTNFATPEKAEAFLKTYADPSITVKLKWFEPSHKAQTTTPELHALREAHEAVTGQKPRLIKRHGAADMRFYSDKGMQAVTYGLPDNNTHGDDEYVTLDAVEQYEQVLNNFLERI